MSEASTPDFMYRKVYPSMRNLMGLGRKIYGILTKVKTNFMGRPLSSPVIPDVYKVCNTDTIDSDMDLNLLSGQYPGDLDGSLFICQCLGSPDAFMVGDTNIVRLDFSGKSCSLTNRLMWNPAAMARIELAETKHRFDFFGLMFLSPGLGLYSYTEGMYLMPDGRIAVTSDVDRPWLIERDSLKAVTPLGRRDEWLPMMSGKAGEAMGNLFAGYNNSHVIYTDVETSEVFLANFQYKQVDGSHPLRLMKWNGKDSFKSWLVVDEEGKEIEVKQSIHELVFTRDYILMADTAFVAGTEMLTPWVNAPLPSDKTVIHIVDRRHLKDDCSGVTAKTLAVDEACIHILAEYDNPDDVITAYMLHTPATNTAELLRRGDRTLEGELYPDHLVGYGTLPVLDLSSVGKHKLNAADNKVVSSEYIAQMPFTWGPYLYAYMGRQERVYNGGDLFIMFKGFSKDMLPRRIYEAYKDSNDRRLAIEEMVEGKGFQHNNSICRISTVDFRIADSYVFPDRVLLYTIACLDSSEKNKPGYVIAGVATDEFEGGSSGHEYWLFAADDLSSGPICKMGHKSLNNSTLFHTVYIPSGLKEKLDKKKTSYHVSLREDYPESELKKWDPSVLRSFKDLIWPYFDGNDGGRSDSAEQIARELSGKRINEHAGREHIIGELPITNAPQMAEDMIAEANRMWRTSGWKRERRSRGILVESKPVSGVFGETDILVMRSRAVIKAEAAQVFDLLTSPEGFAILDPVSRAEDHHKPPLEVYDWKKGSRLEAALAEVDMPGMAKAEFVVLNAIDPDRLIFASKSSLHPGRPGSSIYYDGDYEAAVSSGTGRDPIRALNTMAIMAEPLGEGTCRLYILNYVDMAMKKGQGSLMYNLINRNFFHPLYRRIEKHLKRINDG